MKCENEGFWPMSVHSASSGFRIHDFEIWSQKREPVSHADASFTEWTFEWNTKIMRYPEKATVAKHSLPKAPTKEETENKHWPDTIKKTRLYNFEPLKPNFYIVYLGFTGVYIFSYFAKKYRL